MTVPPSFPTLPGQGWSVHKRPTFATRVAGHISGREVRSALYTAPLYEFELTYDGLASDSSRLGLADLSLQTLMGFYLLCQGQFGTFLYIDPTDNAVSEQVIASGDGSTEIFTLQRTIGGYTEPVSWVTAISSVSLAGIVQTSGWSLTQPNSLTFTNAPASGSVITADFSYGFVCRFLDDQNDFENFMAGLWKLDSLKFRSVKP
jgi:hypothetical protein